MSIDKPATPTVPLQRFFFRGYAINADRKFARVQGFYNAPAQLTAPQLKAMFEEQIRAEFARLGISEAGAFELSEKDQHHLLPAIPRPDPADARPLRHWQLEADFVVHDVRFTTLFKAVFAWPEEPQGAVLHRMLDAPLADALVLRGDEPTYTQLAELRAIKITPTDAPVTYPE